MDKTKFMDLKVTKGFKFDPVDSTFKGNLNKKFAMIDKDILDAAIGTNKELVGAIEFAGTVITASVTERVTAKGNSFWLKVDDIKSIKRVIVSTSSMAEDPVLKRVRVNYVKGDKSKLGYIGIEQVMDRLRLNNSSFKENGFPEFYQTPNTIKTFVDDIVNIKVDGKKLADLMFGDGAVSDDIVTEIWDIYGEFKGLSKQLSSKVVVQESGVEVVINDDTELKSAKTEVKESEINTFDNNEGNDETDEWSGFDL